MTLYVLGGGTLGRFIVDIAADCDDLVIGGFFDDRYPAVTMIDGLPIVGRFADATPDLHRHLAIGIGEPTVRRSLFRAFHAAGFELPSVVHPSAVISRNAHIADGVIVGPQSTVLSGSQIGTGCCMLSQVNINHDTIVHPWCLIGASVAVGNGAILGEGCHIAMGRLIAPAATVPAWSYAD
jgi:acetyltransferase-like isoleucine patch superfamily enzyme